VSAQLRGHLFSVDGEAVIGEDALDALDALDVTAQAPAGIFGKVW